VDAKLVGVKLHFIAGAGENTLQHVAFADVNAVEGRSLSIESHQIAPAQRVNRAEPVNDINFAARLQWHEQVVLEPVQSRGVNQLPNDKEHGQRQGKPPQDTHA